MYNMCALARGRRSTWILAGLQSGHPPAGFQKGLALRGDVREPHRQVEDQGVRATAGGQRNGGRHHRLEMKKNGSSQCLNT